MIRSLLAGAIAFCFAVSFAGATSIDFKDTRRGDQWYLDAMNFPDAWGTLYEQPRHSVIRSAVLDSGFDLDHRDLQANTFKGYNIITGQRVVSPVHAHGTATLGILAAESGNQYGITRAALTTYVLPVQITNRSDGAASLYDMARSIRYAADRGVRVINLSYTGVHSNLLADAAHYAAKRGAVVFMSAGNDGEVHSDWFNHNWIVAVGSVGKSNKVSSFSSKGSFVDFVAPGESIVTTRPGDSFSSWSGTSFSSPLAASVASMILTANPNLASGQVIRILRDTAIDIGAKGFDTSSGHGLIDAAAAVELALNTKGKWSDRRARVPITWIANDLEDHAGLELSTALAYPLDPIASDAIPEPSSALLLLVTSSAYIMRRRANI